MMKAALPHGRAAFRMGNGQRANDRERDREDGRRAEAEQPPTPPEQNGRPRAQEGAAPPPGWGAVWSATNDARRNASANGCRVHPNGGLSGFPTWRSPGRVPNGAGHDGRLAREKGSWAAATARSRATGASRVRKGIAFSPAFRHNRTPGETDRPPENVF